jgi:hypothetical protein
MRCDYRYGNECPYGNDYRKCPEYQVYQWRDAMDRGDYRQIVQAKGRMKA